MFAWSNVLLSFDYDGTLAPLVSAPARATMRVSTRHLLRRASRLYPCVVIRVGRKRTSAAPYCIRNQAEIDRLLGTLVALRGDRK